MVARSASIPSPHPLVECVSRTGLEASPGSGRGRLSIPEAGKSRWLISLPINVQIQGLFVFLPLNLSGFGAGQTRDG